jgi:hypothetical protein
MVSGDLLSAASLLVTLIALLYSTWYGEMTQALEIRIARFRLDREPDVATARRVLLTRAVPLALAAIALVAVLAPPAATVVRDAITQSAGDEYDGVKACFVLVWIIAVGLAAATLQRGLSLLTHYRRLNGPDLS